MKKKTTLVHAVCKNCGAQLHGRYCHSCGQDVFAGARRSVKDLVYNFLENIFALDNKILVTLKYLLFFPGRLSREYKNGRIVRYVHPSKLFWFVTIVFFASFSLYIKNITKGDVELTKIQKETNKPNHDAPTKKETTLKVTDSLIGDSLKLATDSPIASKKTKPQKVKEGISDVQLFGNEYRIDMSTKDKQNALLAFFLTYAPYFSLLLIPFFALLLAVFFRKREYFYVDHLSFALHFHSFVFILIGICIGIDYFFQISYARIIFFAPPIYMIVALYIFYRPKILKLILKFFLLNVFYFFTLVTLIVFIFIVFVYSVGEIN